MNVERVTVSVPKQLLEWVDASAQRTGLNRSEFFCRCVEWVQRDVGLIHDLMSDGFVASAVQQLCSRPDVRERFDRIWEAHHPTPGVTPPLLDVPVQPYQRVTRRRKGKRANLVDAANLKVISSSDHVESNPKTERASQTQDDAGAAPD